ncbi:MAG TPA: hypothetical protein VN681_04980 [Stellaceae bacterium]|nr:hypothetical protein [Stellaceae bacterium]
MSKPHPAPVPPAGRSDKHPAQGDTDAARGKTAPRSPPGNLAEQDRQGNIRENARHQGYQQDR